MKKKVLKIAIFVQDVASRSDGGFFLSLTVHDISFMNKIITSYMNLNWFITQISMTLQAAFHALGASIKDVTS